MQTVVIVIHLMVVSAMVGLVLLQRSEGGGFTSSAGGVFTSRGSANVLTRSTAILAGVFFCTSLVLSIIAGWDRKPHSILEGATPAGQQAPASAPAAPGSGGHGVLDQLRGQGAPAGPSGGPPAEPAAPQVPQSK